MNQTEFTNALIRLSKWRVGITEACTMFALADGATIKQLSKSFETNSQTIKGRVGVLRAKKLVKTVFKTDGSATYYLTPRGAKIIAETINEKAHS